MSGRAQTDQVSDVRRCTRAPDHLIVRSVRHVAVVVPANNEEDHIEACLKAIDIARVTLHQRTLGTVSSSVLVVLDDCHDATATAVASHPDVHAVISCAGQVGRARRLGAERALAEAARNGLPPREVWLANTDADSVPGSDWLTTMVEFAGAGADLVLGTVLPGPGLPSAVEDAWFARHRLQEHHDHVHGANFGISGEAYCALDGWSAMPSGEDVDLALRAAQAGKRIRRTARNPVITSTRALARAPHGFSSYLRTLHPGWS